MAEKKEAPKAKKAESKAEKVEPKVEKVVEPVKAEDKKYIVVRSFTDLQNNNKAYYNGDTFEGSEERIKELSSKSNKQGLVLIKEVK